MKWNIESIMDKSAELEEEYAENGLSDYFDTDQHQAIQNLNESLKPLLKEGFEISIVESGNRIGIGNGREEIANDYIESLFVAEWEMIFEDRCCDL